MLINDDTEDDAPCEGGGLPITTSAGTPTPEKPNTSVSQRLLQSGQVGAELAARSPGRRWEHV